MTINPLVSWPTSNGLWPGAPSDPHFLPGGIGPRWLPMTLDFTSVSTISSDLGKEELLQQLGTVQSVYIDATNVTSNVTFTIGVTQQKIVVAGGAQAILPIACVWPLTFTAVCADGVKVGVMFGNMPMAPAIWSSQSVAAKLAWRPLGYQQISSSVVQSLTVPAGSTMALIAVETNAIRWRDDGTAPTAAIGMPVGVGQEFQYQGKISAIQFIPQAGSMTLDVSYYS